jgi:hypothetical protein
MHAGRPEGIDAEVWTQFVAAYPEVGDVSALEQLYGRSFGEDLARLVTAEVPDPIGPSPSVLVGADNTFEALMLRVQEVGDTISMLLPLTGTIYVRSVWVGDLLVHVAPGAATPLTPFVGWLSEPWTRDLVSAMRLMDALPLFFQQGDDEGAFERLAPIWERVGQPEKLRRFYDDLAARGLLDRLTAAAADRPRSWDGVEPGVLPRRHKRGLFIAFAVGKGEFGHFDPADLPRTPDADLASPSFLADVHAQLYWLWRCWLLEEVEALHRVREALAGSTSRLVLDALRLQREVDEGRAEVGDLDLHEVRAKISRYARDPEAPERDYRAATRRGLADALTPSPYGVELRSADWPLAQTPVAATPDPWSHAASGVEAEYVTIDDAKKLRVVAPGRDAPWLVSMPDPYAVGQPFSPVAVDALRAVAVVNATCRSATGWTGCLMSCDLNTGAWRKYSDLRGAKWLRNVADNHWLADDGESLYELRDIGGPEADFTGVFHGQSRYLPLPGHDAILTFGKNDLARGRPLTDNRGPRVKVIAWWDGGLVEVASFGIDGAEVAIREGGSTTVGLIDSDRSMAWEVVGLESGIAAAIAAAKTRAEEERAAAEAFGEITVDRIVEALNTLRGQAFTPAAQALISSCFAEALAEAEADEAIVAAARAAPTHLHFAKDFKGLLVKRLARGFADPATADFVVRATTHARVAEIAMGCTVLEAWRRLRA